MANRATFAHFTPLPDGQPFWDHPSSYTAVLGKGFSSLPQEGEIQMLQVLMIRIHQRCLALVGQFKLKESTVNEGCPIFKNSVEVQVSCMGTRCQIIPQFSQANANSTFYGSHYFAAFTITYQNPPPPSADFQTALKDPSATFVHENFVLQRVPDRWVSFNQIEGLKFFHQFPPYFEMRVHQRERSLIDEQRRELDVASKAIMDVKQKQLQILDRRSEVEAEKQELEKKLALASPEERENLEKEIQKREQRLSALDKQLQDAEELIKKNGGKFTAVINQKIINASHMPVLRVLAESQVSETESKFQQMVLCLSQSVSLTRDHFPEVFCTFIPTCSEGLKNAKLAFFRKWMAFLDVHYIQTVHPITGGQVEHKGQSTQVLVSKEDLAKENLGAMNKNLQTLEQLVDLEVNFLKMLQALPMAESRLSNDNSYYLERLRRQMKELEEKLDSNIHSTLDRLVENDEQRYLLSSFDFYHQKMDHLNNVLQDRGLIDRSHLGEQRYICSSDYAEERSLLDHHRALLSYSAFLSLLPDPQHPALPALLQDVRESIPFPDSPLDLNNLPLMIVLRKCQSPLCDPFAADLKGFLDAYKELDQMIRLESTTLDAMQKKWRECTDSLRKIFLAVQPLSSQPNTPVQKGEYDKILGNLLKQLDRTSKTYQQTVDFKKCLAKSDLIEQANFALQLRNELEELLKGEKDSDRIDSFRNACSLLTQVMLDGTRILEGAMSDFPKLSIRTWLSFDDHRYQLQKHVFWPTEQEGGDPFYKSNNTHIPID